MIKLLLSLNFILLEQRRQKLSFQPIALSEAIKKQKSALSSVCSAGSPYVCVCVCVAENNKRSFSSNYSNRTSCSPPTRASINGKYTHSINYAESLLHTSEVRVHTRQRQRLEERRLEGLVNCSDGEEEEEEEEGCEETRTLQGGVSRTAESETAQS